MKPKRIFLRGTALFGTPLRYHASLCLGFSVLVSGLSADAGDLLRGGRVGANGGAPGAASGIGGTTSASTDAARANARDTLARSTRTLDAIRAMQVAARNAAISGPNNLGRPTAPLPDVPNGLVNGGLQVAPAVATDPSKWTGAQQPTQTVAADGSAQVTVTQTTQQALLNWQTFNVGKQTTLTFDQSAGGENVNQWIAFNKVSDPTGNPTQILGSIKAAGQVYLINQNGVIFGGSSQVNARNLTVSSLPINDNLVSQGLLNNRDAQFLFSGLSVPGGADGTPNFNPGPPPASGRYGDVTVQAGAILESPAGSGGNGGRIMLVGPNVTNAGTISTESGQAILAAGLQVAAAAHDGSDPSLRGLDVWVGAVGDYAGAATNAGLIESLTGSAWLSGRQVNQLGVINSSTSVNLNGRIDLKASYGAVGNPNFDSTTELGSGGPMFFNQFTGAVNLGKDSMAQILPDFASGKSVPGTALPERSQVNIEGLAVHFDTNSVLFAPNAEVSVRAGVWPYKDSDGTRTIFGTNGTVNPGIVNYYSGANQRFYFNGGQIYVDDTAIISVAGSVDVFVPLAQSILTVQLRGAELADSPLQRNADLRGQDLTVDIRDTGVYNGKYWLGTPLGDVTGLAGLIERNAAQLTAAGGDITLQAGGSVVVAKGATLDVSGGFFQHEGGLVKTSMLVSGGRLVAIKDATPDQVYDGVFTGSSTFVSKKWNVTTTFETPLYRGTVEQSYVEGAAAGKLSITAPGMVLDGELRGLTVQGPRQRSNPAGLSTLALDFSAETTLQLAGNPTINYIKTSPTPPAVAFSNTAGGLSSPPFALVGDAPMALPAERLASVNLASSLLDSSGFGALAITNPDGSITVPAGVTLATTPKGSLAFEAANIAIMGNVGAAGGSLSFTTYNQSPTSVTEYNIINPSGTVPFPAANAGRGLFTLASGASLSTAALLVDDSVNPVDLTKPEVLDGGNITINSYQALLAGGATLDVSGGAYVSATRKVSYGIAGNLSVLAGKDPAFAGVIGGSLALDSTLAGYSGTTGGTLNIQAGRIQLGGSPSPGVLTLGADFFRNGGFTRYNLTGIGAAGTAPPVGAVESYLPAIVIAAGSTITPLAESLNAVPDPDRGGAIGLRRIVAAPGLRTPVSLAFTALGSDDPFTLDKLEVRGDILMDTGAAISCDAGAGVAFKGGTVTLLGSVSAPGGTISVTGAGAFPLTASQRLLVFQALPTVYLGAAAQLSAAGVTQLVPDAYGRRVGTVFNGGKIAVSGNIVAQSGATLDVSGASGVLDLDPLTLADQASPVNAGLSSTPLQRRGSPTRIDSNGGLIDLSGGQMLLSDATLRGAAGGSGATGGELSVFSGNYYAEGASRTSADVNLVVQQSGNVILNPGAKMGVGIGLVDQHGAAYGNSGVFAADRFVQGAFASLDLGGKYLANATPVPFGGNIDFRGKIDIQASGTMRIAAGGVIHADDSVRITASYISMGQDFRPPQNPDDLFLVFQQDPPYPSNEYNLAPTYGPGSLSLSAGLIDVGMLSLQNIGHATLTASGGDIRGNGTLSMAGDLVLQAGQIYPTTLAKFEVFAYDHAGVAGSVAIRAAGAGQAPLAAGGSLSIYASNIMQAGVLRAPSGTIRLGWDGTDINPSTAALDVPKNVIAGATIATPLAQNVTLTDGSVTSVSGVGLDIPFGISPDGLTWIDPRGVNVTLSGLPQKSVVIGANSVDLATGATVDIRGGGDLLASRWVAGNGGSVGLLGTASAAWGAGTQYQPGALVTYQGATWSARVRNSGRTPGANLYWSKVQDSYAIIPGFGSPIAPYGAYNTGPNATALAGNPGDVSASLKVGDTITLEASDALAAGTYTLLPRAYAMLDGAYLVTPTAKSGTTGVVAADGSSLVLGYVSNSFNQPVAIPALRTRFEVAPAEVVKSRATYALYSANDFIGNAGAGQRLPADAGAATFQGNSAMRLAGTLLTQAAGRGAAVDISSFAGIYLIGGTGVAPVGAQVALQTGILDAWGAGSLLIGGVRNAGVDGTTIDVRTTGLTLNNPGNLFSGPEIVLASRKQLELTDGSAVASAGQLAGTAGDLLLSGDGTLVRVTGDRNASVTRSAVTGSSVPAMLVGAGASIGGPSVLLDSTCGTSLSPAAVLDAKTLTLGSGQISVVFDNAAGSLSGSVITPQLTLAGVTLAKVQQTSALTLRSYRSIDFYGTGTIGGSALDAITLSGSGLRGYQQGAAGVVIQAKDVRIDNPANVAALATVATTTGNLTINAATIHLGVNQVAVSGFQTLSLKASDRLLFEGVGALTTVGNLQVTTPLITGNQGASYGITSSQAVTLGGNGSHPSIPGELGAGLTIQGTSVAADTDILLPSGQLTLRATGGPLEVGGDLSVAGTARAFNDLTRFSDAGTITLESLTGDVTLAGGSSVAVAAAPAGGNAGTLTVNAPQGIYVNGGNVHGEAGNSGRAGSFLLDVGSLATTGAAAFEAISAALNDGGFFASRNFRIRSGDVSIANVTRSHEFLLAADQGSILVGGTIDASGATGGAISLAARDNLTLVAGAELSVAAANFDSAGKGGSILLEAGTERNGGVNPSAVLDLRAGSQVDLGVAAFIPGSYTDPGSSAFRGQFTGTLHLRAPRTAANNDIQVNPIAAKIVGASSVVVEGYKLYTPAGGVLNIAERNLINTDAISFLGAAGVGNANEAAMRGKLLTGADNPAVLGALLVISPGVELINPTGDLTLGLANNSSAGSTNPEALSSADWDLSGFRYGSRSAPGVLTLRAQGNLVFNNTLSDGFTPIAQGSAQVFADNGNSLMWLANLMTIASSLPVNTQSWSYRLTSGADVNASNFRSVLPLATLDLLQPAKGSLLVGEFYPAVPNTLSTGGAAGVGSLGQTADTIRISTTTTNRGTRFEVVRTGTGDITINAGRDVQLRNQFATIYTAGVALPTPTTVFSTNDFVAPVLPTTVSRSPSQSGGGLDLGILQQLYPATWSMAGGNVSLAAQANIGHYTLVNGVLTPDSSRQMPTNWLYRRGYVDATGLFAKDGGFGTNPNIQNADNINDVATSTTWWIDYSNFFEGVGALGGGNVILAAGNDVVNVDALAPTNARMPGRINNPDFNLVAGAPQYLNVAPDASKLLELGGGDVSVKAGRNIDGGVYYVEKGSGSLFASGNITTNQARSPSLGILNGSAPLDPLTWLPTTLFVGKSHFDVRARGNVLLGPVANVFMLPQGLNNKYWYKTYFDTNSPAAGADVSSYGGDVTFRMAVNLPDGASSRSLLDVWFNSQNLFNGVGSSYNASNFQPWLRLAETSVATFNSVFKLNAPNLNGTAFGGNLNLVGSWSLFPSATGNLELAASSNIIGLQDTGPGYVNSRSAQVWTSSTVNVSDANPASIPGVATPLAYQNAIGRSRTAAVQSSVDILQRVSLALNETGSLLGVAGTSAMKQALHASGLLHAGDPNPVRLYAAGGDITGLTLFSPKETRIIASRDITDIAFYLQNDAVADITLVSAGRDIIPFNENAAVRTLANNLALGNVVGDAAISTAAGKSTSTLAGDIQINGPGVLEILSARDLDLGTGANFTDGRGVGITSIGNTRNPNLPFGGADLIAMTGVSAASGLGPAFGLANSSMDIAAFVGDYLKGGASAADSPYLTKLGWTGRFEDLGDEPQAIVAMETFYRVLRDAGRAAGQSGTYQAGYDAIDTLFSTNQPVGDILTRAREIRTTSGGAISLGAAGGGITMASAIFGNPLTPPGIVTEYGGAISTFTNNDVSIGQARIFTLRGGDITMWSSNGNIAAGTSPKTVVTAPPTRVVIDVTSADVQTDLGGLATGGGIGVLAAVEGVRPGNVDLVAPKGYVDAGDAGIRVTGNLNIAAQVVLNSSNISTGGTSTGATPVAPSTPSVSSVTTASNSSAAAGATVAKPEPQKDSEPKVAPEPLSTITVEVIGYGGGSGDEEDKQDQEGEAEASA